MKGMLIVHSITIAYRDSSLLDGGELLHPTPTSWNDTYIMITLSGNLISTPLVGWVYFRDPLSCWIFLSFVIAGIPNHFKWETLISSGLMGLGYPPSCCGITVGIPYQNFAFLSFRDLGSLHRRDVCLASSVLLGKGLPVSLVSLFLSCSIDSWHCNSLFQRRNSEDHFQGLKLGP